MRPGVCARSVTEISQFLSLYRRPQRLGKSVRKHGKGVWNSWAKDPTEWSKVWAMGRGPNQRSTGKVAAAGRESNGRRGEESQGLRMDEEREMSTTGGGKRVRDRDTARSKANKRQMKSAELAR